LKEQESTSGPLGDKEKHLDQQLDNKSEPEPIDPATLSLCSDVDNHAIIALDTETTARGQCHIIEIACWEMTSNQVFHELVKPLWLTEAAMTRHD